ncbi:MAG: rod shape-determining protein MreC [Ignavibacteria bacterium]|nr:rod shape-determining protein MreC [Ignavibacteria bacterium]
MRILKNIWNQFKEYLILIFLLLISVLLISHSDHSSVKNLKTTTFGTFAFLTSFFADVLPSTGLKSENTKLREQNAKLMLEVNKLREYGIENVELKNLLSLKDTISYQLIPAKVIAKSFSTDQTTFTLNKGNNEGIKAGMAVITGEGLVGIVERSSGDFSLIRTLKHLNFRVVVKDQRSRFQGILHWTGSQLIISNLPKTSEIKLGDRIITSELSSFIGQPFPIGIVKKIINPDEGYFNNVLIKPFVEIEKVENVFIVALIPHKIKNSVELNYYNSENR